MEDNSNNLSYFFLGLGLGVAAGLLLAPKSGADTRDFLLTKANDSGDYLRRQSEVLRDHATNLVDKGKTAANDLVDKSKSAANDLVEKGRTVVSQQKDQLSAAVEAGKQAYREAVGNAPAAPTNPAA